MLTQIKNTIDQGKKFLITSHVDPDGDALGSVFSLYWVLKGLGKEPMVYLKDQVPYRYEFLPRPEQLLHDLPDNSFDALFVLDCGSLFRIGNAHEELKSLGPVVSIDHHETNDVFGSLNYVDSQASSTGELLYRLYRSMEIPMTGNIAVNIFTAVFTDTGSLRYGNASPAAYAICEEMVESGVKPSYVAQMVYESHPIERFILLGAALGTLETLNNGRIAMAHVTEDMFHRTGTSSEHTDGFSEYFREIRGVEVSVFVRQSGDKRFKISMRSKGQVDVARICGIFDGGGHRNAAGCTVEGSLEEVKQRLKEAFNIA